MSCIRHPKTQQERRESVLQENGVRVRAKRSKRSLPTYWEDKPRSDYRHRSWKSHRLTQYRQK